MTHMSCIYFVRHGQTVWNVENRICGASDIALTAKGHEQAIETGEKIKASGISADAILYSPLIRAKDTALHISEITGIPAKEEGRLIEQNFGIYESTARDGAEFREAKKQFMNAYQGGETMFRLAQRIYNLLDEIGASGKTYILVAHNGIARVIQSYFNEMTNDEYAAFGVDNCTINKYEWNGNLLDSLNRPTKEADVKQLKPSKSYSFWGWQQASVEALVRDYPGIKTPWDLYDALSNIWCADTCAPRMRQNWTKDNMTLGQCSITAFLAQDIFGGKVYGILRPGGNYHCYNVVGNVKFDLTSEQFGDEILDYENNQEQFKEIHFSKEEKRLRYEFLKKELYNFCAKD